MFELEQLQFAWPEGRTVLRELSLQIEAGEKLVVLGANGSGKSTLLKLLNGLLQPGGGRCRYAGQELSRAALRDPDFARRFRSEVVLLFQHPEAMLFNPTVRDEIAYGPRRLGLPDTDARVARWAAALQLESLLDQPPYALSGGEKQKVALAALLAMDPACLLLDEPMANLDPRSTGWLVDYLLDSPATSVISTHNLSMAAELGQRCLILREDGRLHYDGPVDAALRDLELLAAANLVHRHRHRHGGVMHSHLHLHDWE
jgi:cobalt/nickel transport system ATP-binding protein